MYKWNPEEYKDSSKNQKSWELELLSKIEFTGSEKVLDIGCGDGRLSAVIADKVPNGSVTGIDLSKNMIQFAENNYSVTYKNLNFKVMNASNINFKEQFDIIFSNAALHWIQDHKPVINGIKNSLKQSGKFYIQFGGKGNAETVIETINKIIKSEKWGKYFIDFKFPYGFYSIEEYEKIINNTKELQIQNIEMIQKKMKFENKNLFSSWIRTTWLPYTKKIPETLRETFIDECVKNYTLTNNNIDNIKMVRLEVIGSKV